MVGQPDGAGLTREAGAAARRQASGGYEIDEIVPGRADATVDVPLLRYDLEQIVAVSEILGRAQEQVATFPQREV